MNFPQLFNDLKKEFPEHIALGVCVAMGIHLSTKIKEKDLSPKGNFEKRVEKKIRNTLWEVSEKDLELIIKLWKCVYDWDIRRALEGLGGCERKTFTQLLEELK